MIVIFCWPGSSPVACSQKIGTLPLTWAYEKHCPDGAQYTVSVSTKLATLPSSSMPRALNRVPALLQESRDIRVKEEGSPDRVARIGAEDEGTVIVSAKPLIAEVRNPDASSALFSRGERRDRKSTRG